jgi:hypothetical protein
MEHGMAKRYTEAKLKRIIQDLIDNDDPCLTVVSAGRRRSALTLSVCRTLDLTGTHHPGMVAKQLLAKAHAGQIEIYQGDERVARPDSDSIKYATRICKVAVAADASIGGPGSGHNLPTASPANRAAQAHDRQCRAAYEAKLASVQRWAPQSALVRDIVFWYLWQQPEHTVDGGKRIKREDILEAAGQDASDVALLQAITNGLKFLDLHGFIKRRVNGKSTTYLRLVVELDEQSVRELRERFSPDTVSVEVAQEVDETTEAMVRRVIREEFATLKGELFSTLNVSDLVARVDDAERRFRTAAKALSDGLD